MPEGAVEVFLVCLPLGLVVGAIAGLLGVGGGLVIVPALLWVLPRCGVGEAVALHLAVGTSVATIVVTSIASMRAHHRRAAVRWPVVARIAPGVAVGAVVGAQIAGGLEPEELTLCVAVFLVFAALRMAFGIKPSGRRSLPGTLGLSIVGALVGTISSIVGIGGGSLNVPFFVWCSLDMRHAVGTAAACGLPIALFGAAGYAWSGQGVAGLPPASTGYVYWPAFVGIVVTSIWSAPLGAALAHRVPQRRLRQGFAVFLAVVAVRLMLR